MVQKTAGAALLLLLTTALPAAAAASEPVLISAPVYADVKAKSALPAGITVNGHAVAMDQKPVLKDETLFLPLRFIAEAAGGQVEWDGGAQTVTVTMPDRTAIFTIGQAEAELNMRGVMYIKRNMIKLAAPVQIIEGRTMVSADAASSILGLGERPDTDAILDLMTKPKEAADLPAGKVMAGDAQVAATAVAAADAPASLKAWANGLGVEGATATYTVITAEDGLYVGIAAGQQPTGGYRIELIGGGARLIDGVWHVDAQVIAPDGPAIEILTNPVAYFKLPGASGNVEVQFWTNGATP